jgi:hypothetical protein
MRPEFKVTVRGDMQAIEALAAAHLKVAAGPPDISNEIQVIVSASDPDQARDQVTRHLPPDGNYTIDERIARVESD